MSEKTGYKEEKDKVKPKTFKWTDAQLEHFGEEKNRMGLAENTYVRKLVDAGIEVLSVKEEGYTVMVLNFRDDQIEEINRVAIEHKMTPSEIMRACVDYQFNLEEKP